METGTEAIGEPAQRKKEHRNGMGAREHVLARVSRHSVVVAATSGSIQQVSSANDSRGGGMAAATQVHTCAREWQWEPQERTHERSKHGTDEEP
eukprot:5119845-Prymnesium_polylepis.2